MGKIRHTCRTKISEVLARRGLGLSEVHGIDTAGGSTKVASPVLFCLLALMVTACATTPFGPPTPAEGLIAKVPEEGPRAVAWIEVYTLAILSGINEAKAISFANKYSETEQAGETPERLKDQVEAKWGVTGLFDGAQASMDPAGVMGVVHVLEYVFDRTERNRREAIEKTIKRVEAAKPLCERLEKAIYNGERIEGKERVLDLCLSVLLHEQQTVN